MKKQINKFKIHRKKNKKKNKARKQKKQLMTINL